MSPDAIVHTGLDPALLSALRDLLGARCSTSRADREHHGRDESYHPVTPPDAVCHVESTAEVSAVMALCARHRTAVVAVGAGTSLEGHIAALRGGVAIDLKPMNRIVEVNVADLDATVQAGVTRKQLNQHLRDTGLFFPIDPGADATIGGMAATRASGTVAVRYGTMRDNVIRMTVVLADGAVIRTASRARKSAAGYDLTRLFVGQEGTLGIITEVTVRLYGIPETIGSGICPFPDVAAAVDTVIEAIQCGIPVARIDLLDDVAIGAVNRHAKLNNPPQPTLFVEFHGTPHGVAEQSEALAAIAAGHGAAGLRWSTDADERNRLWQARHDLHYATLALRPGAKVWGTDVCVPISRLAECIAATRADTQGASFPVVMAGHVGDGNFHCGMVIDPDSAAERAEAAAINDRLVTRALAMGGTCTGEHGVGRGKIKFMQAEHGDALRVMRRIKAALDPDDLLNPGKILPPG